MVGNPQHQDSLRCVHEKNVNVNRAYICVNVSIKLDYHNMLFIADAGFEHIHCPYEDGTFQEADIYWPSLGPEHVEWKMCRMF